LGANSLSAVGYLLEVRVPVIVWLGLQNMLRQQKFCFHKSHSMPSASAAKPQCLWHSGFAAAEGGGRRLTACCDERADIAYFC